MSAGRLRPLRVVGWCAVLLAAAGGRAPGVSAAAPQQDGGLTVDHLLSIAHPGPPVWSPVGDRIAFLRELDGAVDLWWTSEQLDQPVAVTHEADGDTPGGVSGFAWTSAADALVYELRGDLFLYRVESGATETLAASESAETAPVLTADGARIAFLRDGRPWVGTFPALDGGFVVDDEGPFRSLLWSPDGLYLAAAYGRIETVHEDTRALMGSKVEFSRRETVSSGLAVIDVQQGDVYRVESGDAYSSQPAFSAAGTLAWQEISADAKSRRILVAAAPDWTPRVVVDESDDTWWTLTYLDAGPRWSPAGERFVFVSERDGWAHAYLLDVDRPDAAALQLTAGAFEVEEPAWSPDGRTLLLSANRGSSSERGLQLLEVPAEGAGGRPPLEPISRLRGTSVFGRWRADGAAIAFLHADPENPLDLWVKEPGPTEARQLSDAWPEDADETELVLPQRVRFSSADGELIPAQLFLPPDSDDTAAASARIVTDGIRAAPTRCSTAFTSTCCSAATRWSRSIIAAASVTGGSFARGSTSTSVGAISTTCSRRLATYGVSTRWRSGA